MYDNIYHITLQVHYIYPFYRCKYAKKNIMLSKMIIMIMIQVNNMKNFQPRGLNGIGIILKFGLLSKLPELYRLDYSKNMNFANSCICEY